MFIFQYAHKDEEPESAKLSTKLRMFHEFANAQLSVEAPARTGDDVLSSVSAIEKAFKEKGVSAFMSTLTPGAQNAIYAASFAWGYENAVKYLKGAMKQGEVKNAADTEDRSRLVIESIQSQASDKQPEVAHQTSNFVWSFYNEDMKETQAHVAKSDVMTQKSPNAKEDVQLPMNAPEAVAMSIANNSHNSALLYCSASQQQAEDIQERQNEEIKKNALTALIGVGEVRGSETHSQERPGEPKIILAETIKQHNERASDEQEFKLALERKEDVLEEYKKTEQALIKALDTIDELSKGEDALKKIAPALPKELFRLLARRSPSFASRYAFRVQLVKWLAFCKKGRRELGKLPNAKLSKLVSLSSLLKLGR